MKHHTTLNLSYKALDDQDGIYRDVGSAGLVGNIARPTYRDVGSAGLVGNIARPTYRDVGSAGLVGNIARPTYRNAGRPARSSEHHSTTGRFDSSSPSAAGK